MRHSLALLFSPLVLAACAAPATLENRPRAVVMTPDRAESPRIVRFDLPTAMLMDLPGGRIPNTLEARVATRDIASHELAVRGWCPDGFEGPDRIHFPGGDRGHSAFEVACRGR